jgi:hypothetical protein
MKPLLISLALLLTTPAMMDAQFLNTYQWKSRLVLLFTPSPDDPLFLQQMSLLAEQSEAFEERDVLFISITPNGEYENTGRFLEESLARQYHQHFSPDKNQFELIVVGLDSTEKLRARNTLTPPSVLLELIDGMPMRRQELRQGYGNKRQTNGGGL